MKNQVMTFLFIFLRKICFAMSAQRHFRLKKTLRILKDDFIFFPDSFAPTLFIQGEYMRLFFLFVTLILIASCGQDGGGSSSNKSRGICSLNGRSVQCETIRGADGQGIDLLESMIDVPIQMQDTEMTFLADKTATSTGRRITCKTAVKKGEVYRFALRGAKLLLMTPEGSFEMDRLNDGSEINGAWAWKGYTDEGTHLIRQMTILNSNRVIMRTNCEL